MNTTMRAVCATLILGCSVTANAKNPVFTVTVDGVASGKTIPAEQAVCLPTAEGKSDASGKNIRPTIRWAGAPKGTKSFAVFMMDPDVPADFADAGKEGKIIAKKAKRQDFYHYAVVNIPADISSLAGGDASKEPGVGEQLVNDMGLNTYVAKPTQYGGPCPPWNDARMHHYHFIVLALDAEAPVTAPTLRKAEISVGDPNTAKHTLERLLASKYVLAKGVVIGTYSLNKELRR